MPTLYISIYYISKVIEMQESKYVFRAGSGFNVFDIIVGVVIYSMHWMLGVLGSQPINSVVLF